MTVRDRTWQYLLILLFLVALSLACNAGGAFGPKNDEPASTPIAASLDVDGGEILGPSGLRLLVPGGALAAPAEFQLAEAESQAAPLPGAGAASAAYEVEMPAGTDPLFPLEMVVPLDASNSGARPLVFRWDGRAWDYLGGEVEDDGLHVYVDHFSILQAWGDVDDTTKPVMFVNWAGDPAWVLPWEWDSPDSWRYNLPFAFTMRRGLFGDDPTWHTQVFPLSTVYSWCVQWEEWTEPYWDLHGGAFVSEYIGTYHFYMDFPITVAKDSPERDPFELLRVEFSTGGGGEPGTCGEPPGQIDRTATPPAAVQPEGSETPDPQEGSPAADLSLIHI